MPHGAVIPSQPHRPRQGAHPGARISAQVVLRRARPTELSEPEKGFEPRRLPWQGGTTAFLAVTRRYKIAKSQPQALPGRSTRFAEVVLLVVLRDLEHHSATSERLRPGASR